MQNHITAIIWDYDCTLADTWYKNLMVTRKLIAHVTGRDTSHLKALSSLDVYRQASLASTNWREFYGRSCKLNEMQVDLAGTLWTQFQLQDETPVQFFEGLGSVLEALGDFPHGVVSQNSRQRIASSLQEQGFLSYIKAILGYEEVPFDKQKPAPDALLLCIEGLTNFSPGIVFYIGDHEVDTACVFRANDALHQKGLDIIVKSIGAFYGCDHDDTDWTLKPDYRVKRIQDIVTIIQQFNS